MVGRCNGPRSAWRPWGTIRDRGDRSRRRSSSASGSRRRLPGSIPVACAASSGMPAAAAPRLSRTGSRCWSSCVRRGTHRNGKSGESREATGRRRTHRRRHDTAHVPLEARCEMGAPWACLGPGQGGSASAALAGCLGKCAAPEAAATTAYESCSSLLAPALRQRFYAALRSSAARRGRGGRSRRSPRRPSGSRAASPFGALDHADDVRRRPRRPKPSAIPRRRRRGRQGRAARSTASSRFDSTPRGASRQPARRRRAAVRRSPRDGR